MHPGPRDSIEEYGQKLGFVYGRVTAIAHYEYPMATGLHWAYVNNYSGGLPDWPDKMPALRFYVDFYSKIEGPLNPRFDNDKEWHKEGELDSYWSNEPDALPGYWWVDAVHLEFNLKKERWGKYDLCAESTLTAKKDINGDGVREKEDWTAEAKLEDFDHEDEPLSVE